MLLWEYPAELEKGFEKGWLTLKEGESEGGNLLEIEPNQDGDAGNDLAEVEGVEHPFREFIRGINKDKSECKEKYLLLTLLQTAVKKAMEHDAGPCGYESAAEGKRKAPRTKPARQVYYYNREAVTDKNYKINFKICQ